MSSSETDGTLRLAVSEKSNNTPTSDRTFFEARLIITRPMSPVDITRNVHTNTWGATATNNSTFQLSKRENKRPYGKKRTSVKDGVVFKKQPQKQSSGGQLQNIRPPPPRPQRFLWRSRTTPDSCRHRLIFFFSYGPSTRDSRAPTTPIVRRSRQNKKVIMTWNTHS